MVRASKRDSVYLFSPIDFRKQAKKTSFKPLTIETLSESSSENEEEKYEGLEIKNENEKGCSPINERTIAKPVFRYLPNEVEIRLMFNQVLKEGF